MRRFVLRAATRSVLRNPLVVGGALLTGFLALLAASMAFAFVSTLSSSSPGVAQPSQAAVADIPANMLQLYMQAGQTYGIDWAILAAIGSIETDHCRSTAPGVKSGGNSKGAMGCMQFLAGTWASYGVDGNHDGLKVAYDPADAIPAAANYLKASGAPGDYHRAIFAYNHADWYVAQVLAKAQQYRGALQAAPPLSSDATISAVLTAIVRLDKMHVPYNYGGGHMTPAQPGPGAYGSFPGLDCSSAVSWVLQHAGINVPTLDSTSFMSWGDPGPGLVTLYANPEHIFMSIEIAGHKRYFGTSGFGHPEAGTGAAWFTRPVRASYIAGFTQRHPRGM